LGSRDEGVKQLPLDEDVRRRLIEALIEEGWSLEGDSVFAPHRSMWLLVRKPWHGDLPDMLERMRGRTERVQRHLGVAGNDAGDDDGWQVAADTLSLVRVLEGLSDTRA
jgi:hypothetical protein